MLQHTKIIQEMGEDLTTYIIGGPWRTFRFFPKVLEYVNITGQVNSKGDVNGIFGT
jgi:hypothetical protein